MKRADSLYIQYDKLRRSSPVMPGKRFLSFLIDFFIHLGLVCAIFIPSVNGVMQMDVYQKEVRIQENEVKYYNDYIAESKIVMFEDDSHKVRFTTDEEAYIYLCRNICLSYYTFGNADEPDFVLNEQVQEFGILNEDNEQISYFYTKYLQEEKHKGYFDFKGIKPMDYVYNAYEDQLGNVTRYFRDMRDSASYPDAPKFPILKTSVAYGLMKSMFTEDNEFVQTYNNLVSAYTNILNVSEEVMIKAEPYYSTHYLPYNESFRRAANVVNTYLLIVAFVTGFLVYGLSRIIFGNCMTVGKKLLSIGAINFKREPVTKLPLTGIIAMDIIFSSIICLVMYFFPPFGAAFSTFTIPFVSGLPLSLGMIVLILGLVYIINACGILLSHWRQSLLEMFFMVVYTDAKHVNEDPTDDVNEATPS